MLLKKQIVPAYIANILTFDLGFIMANTPNVDAANPQLELLSIYALYTCPPPTNPIEPNACATSSNVGMSKATFEPIDCLRNKIVGDYGRFMCESIVLATIGPQVWVVGILLAKQRRASCVGQSLGSTTPCMPF